jgi:hypothetical protein
MSNEFFFLISMNCYQCTVKKYTDWRVSWLSTAKSENPSLIYITDFRLLNYMYKSLTFPKYVITVWYTIKNTKMS